MTISRIASGLVLAALVFSAYSANAQVIIDRKGDAISRISSSDFLSEANSGKYYTENWTMMLRSNRGHVIYLTFLKSNIGVFSGSSGVTLSLALPGKEATHKEFQYSMDDFKEDKATGTITIGPNTLSLKGNTAHLIIKENGMEMDLTIKGKTPGTTFHSGRMYFDKGKSKWMRTFIHIPNGKVSGELVLGGTKVPFKGVGFLDHLRQNVLGTDYATHWWCARYFGDKYTVAFFTYKTPKSMGGEMIGRLMVMDDSKVLLHTTDFTLTTSGEKKDPKGHKYAKEFKISYKGEDMTLEGTFTGGRQTDRDAMLDRMNAAERQVVKMFAGNPINYRHEGQAEITLTLPGQEPVVLKGKTDLESIVFNDE